MIVYPFSKREDTSFVLQEQVILQARFVKPYELNIARTFSRLNLDAELLNLISTFNKHIISIDSRLMQYKVEEDYYSKEKNWTLPFTQLSTSERLFALCFMADKAKMQLTVGDDIASLDMMHHKNFISLWGDSKYINVIDPQGMGGFIFNKLYSKHLINKEAT